MLFLKRYWILILIIILGASLRFYRLGNIPFGYTWDEISTLYNGWSISLWHRDENAIFMPLSFKSFGDYKAPFLTYALSLLFLIAEPSEIYIRIYCAIAGTLTVVFAYLISLEIFENMRYKNQIGLTSALLFSISPWAIQFSRFGFEYIIALLFVVSGIYFLLKSRKNTKWLYLSILPFALSLYTYHSTKIFIPLFGFAYLFFYRNTIKSNIKHYIFSLIIFSVLISPLVYATLYSGAGERGFQSLIFFDSNHKLLPMSTIITQIIDNLLSYISLSFWLKGFDASSIRHVVPGFGVSLYAELVLFLIGMFLIIKKRDEKFILIIWLVIGLVPAVLSHPNPHAGRSLLVLPTVQIIAAFAAVNIYYKLAKKRKDYAFIFGLIFIASASLNFYFYIREYYGNYDYESAREFQYGYKEAFRFIKEYDQSIEKIYFTRAYGQPYIYALWYEQITPQEYQWGGLSKYVFVDNLWPIKEKNILVVASPDQIPPHDSHVVKIIYFPSSSQPVFVIAKT